MIYIQLLQRSKAETGRPIHLSDIARLIGPDALGQLPLACPEAQGIWKMEAIAIAGAVKAAFPHEDVTLLGPDVCYIHRVHALRPDPTRPLRTAAAMLILCLGGALGLAWFHADVDMPRAQLAVYEALTGRTPSDSRLITIPYALGVALGVAVFYALPSSRATTPLEVKLTAYQEDMEKTEGRRIE